MEKAKEICPTTTNNKVVEGVFLVDVREKEEVNELSFDVSNIIHIPLTEFENRYTEVPKDKEVVLVSKNGVNSLKATYFLMNHGWSNAMNMQHGLIRWVQKGFPIKGNTKAIKETTGSCCGTENTNSSCC